MPIYEYKCTRCSEKFEIRRCLSESGKELECPKCGEIYPATLAFCANDGSALVEEES